LRLAYDILKHREVVMENIFQEEYTDMKNVLGKSFKPLKYSKKLLTKQLPAEKIFGNLTIGEVEKQ